MQDKIKNGKTIKVKGIIQGGYLHFLFFPQCFQWVSGVTGVLHGLMVID